MKLLRAALAVSLLVAWAVAESGQSSVAAATGARESSQTEVTITRHGSQPVAIGQAGFFTGTVRVESQFQRGDPARVTGAVVTFEPGARTAWHTHPLGQTLIVTAGSGLVQQWGGAIQEMKPGDVVWIPPGVKHWHGATATEQMTHTAIQERLAGKNVEWLEKVSDEEYSNIRGATPGSQNMKLRIKVGDEEIVATLVDSETTRDFVSLLPLTLTMNDLFKREKFAHLPRAISEGGKRTHTYAVGDVIYWPPGPDVAVFYRHDGEAIPSPGAVVLAKVHSGIQALRVPGAVTATFALAE
jgi:quercetin dioxygenase-like cupin family protein